MPSPEIWTASEWGSFQGGRKALRTTPPQVILICSQSREPLPKTQTTCDSHAFNLPPPLPKGHAEVQPSSDVLGGATPATGIWWTLRRPQGHVSFHHIPAREQEGGSVLLQNRVILSPVSPGSLGSHESMHVAKYSVSAACGLDSALGSQEGFYEITGVFQS